MFRRFAVLALALAVSAVFAQVPMPEPERREIGYTYVPLDANVPVVYIDAVGDTTGIARQLFKEVSLDSTMLADLGTSAVVLVPAPGADRYIIPRYMTTKREGAVVPADFASEGAGFLTFAYGTETSGFLSLEVVRAMRPPFNFFDRSGEYVGNAFYATAGQEFTTLPSGLNTTMPIANTPLHLYPTILRQGMSLTDLETWAAITAKVSGDYSVTVRLYYQIVRL